MKWKTFVKWSWKILNISSILILSISIASIFLFFYGSCIAFWSVAGLQNYVEPRQALNIINRQNLMLFMGLVSLACFGIVKWRNKKNGNC